MGLFLDLHRDRMRAGGSASLAGGAARTVYVVDGSVSLGETVLGADEGAFVSGAAALVAGPEGATFWRFALVRDGDAGDALAGGESGLLLRADLAPVDVDDGGSWLMRLDSVAFPPGGCALLHTHQGPGIRCLVEGSIRIDTEGRSTAYRPGEAWFEAGPEPVYAAADAHVPSRFVRTMILPGRLAGQSSIRYVREEDRDVPKSQRYRVYAEQML